MPNIRLLDTDQYGTATLAESSEAAALPAEATQDPDRSYVWRSLTQTGTQEIDIDLGSVKAVTACAVANVTLVGTGALELYERGDAASAGAATLVATLPSQDAERRAAVSFFASQSHRHWQLKWTNPGADSAYAELGFCALGTYTEPTVNVSAPLPLAEVDPSVVRLSVDRQRRTVARTRYLAGTWTWQDVADADRDSLEALFRSLGVRVPLFMTLDTTLAWTTVLGYVTSGLQQGVGVLSGRYDVAFSWEEAT